MPLKMPLPKVSGLVWADRDKWEVLSGLFVTGVHWHPKPLSFRYWGARSGLVSAPKPLDRGAMMAGRGLVLVGRVGIHIQDIFISYIFASLLVSEYGIQITHVMGLAALSWLFCREGRQTVLKSLAHMTILGPCATRNVFLSPL